jgi:hypothetical protein
VQNDSREIKAGGFAESRVGRIEYLMDARVYVPAERSELETVLIGLAYFEAYRWSRITPRATSSSRLLSSRQSARPATSVEAIRKYCYANL